MILSQKMSSSLEKTTTPLPVSLTVKRPFFLRLSLPWRPLSCIRAASVFCDRVYTAKDFCITLPCFAPIEIKYWTEAIFAMGSLRSTCSPLLMALENTSQKNVFIRALPKLPQLQMAITPKQKSYQTSAGAKILVFLRASGILWASYDRNSSAAAICFMYIGIFISVFLICCFLGPPGPHGTPPSVRPSARKISRCTITTEPPPTYQII